MDKINILGTEVSKTKTAEILHKISAALNYNKKLFIVTANAEGLMLARKDKEFKDIVNSADIVTADGIGVLWAARILNCRTRNSFLRYIEIPIFTLISLFAIIFHPSSLKKILPERIAGSDLFWEIIHKAYEEDKSIYLLGGAERAAELAKQKLEKKLKGIKVFGAYPGSPREKGLVERINNSRAQILFVAWGQPKQEKWIYENLDKLNVNVAIGVGGTFDFVAGKIKRAPKLVQKIGLEWLWRVFREPKRIGRIITAVPVFIYVIIKEKLKNK